MKQHNTSFPIMIGWQSLNLLPAPLPDVARKTVKRIVKKAAPKKPTTLPISNDEDAENKRFKGIANQTANQTVLGSEKGIKQVVSPVLTGENSPTPLLPKLDLNNVVVTPFSSLDTPPVQVEVPVKPSPPPSITSPTEDQTKIITTGAPSKSSTPENNENKSNEISPTEDGAGGGSKTPRKRRTWGAVNSNPLLMPTPTVVTRAAMKRIAEEQSSMCQQTFMECHTMLDGDSVLSPPAPVDASPPPLPFPAPNETLATVATTTTAAPPSPVPTGAVAGGPLTATPMHPLLTHFVRLRDPVLMLPLAGSGSRSEGYEITPLLIPPQKSEAFVIPAIETTTSTVDLSHEGPIASTPAPQPKVPAPPKIVRTAKPTATKPKRPEFKAPTIGTESRPKTAPGRPGLAGRDALRKTLGGDVMRRPVKAAKRRSKSADRVEKPKLKTATTAAAATSSVASNSKMPKRKGGNMRNIVYLTRTLLHSPNGITDPLKSGSQTPITSPTEDQSNNKITSAPSKSSTPENNENKCSEMISPTEDGGSAGSKTPRKRRTWGAVDSNPLLMPTPTVVTRAAMKRIAEEQSSMCQQTFMECHTMLDGDSVLSPPAPVDASPPPLPFPAPNETLATVASTTTAAPPSPVPTGAVAGGPLTATPMHPLLTHFVRLRDPVLMLPLAGSGSRSEGYEITPLLIPPQKSEAFVIPAIETTTSTVDLSHEGPIASTPAPQPKVPAPPKIVRTAKPTATKPKRPEFKAPTIGTESRPKTAPGRPGLAGRDALRKTLGGDVMRRPVKAAKRRSKSADRVEKPKLKTATTAAAATSSVASNSKMPKRKGAMCPPKSPIKRLRPLQRISSADDAFREKRHRSADVLKTPIDKNKIVFRQKQDLSPAQVVVMPCSLSVSTLVPPDTSSLGSGELPPHIRCPVVGTQVVIMPRVGVSSLLDLDTLLSLDGSGITPLHSNVLGVGVLAEVVVPPGGMGRLGGFNDLDTSPSPDGSGRAPFEILGETGRTLRGNEGQEGKQTNLRDHVEWVPDVGPATGHGKIFPSSRARSLLVLPELTPQDKYTVNHEQKPIEEFNYTVSRIETDLRDGTRLCRLAEILTETPLCDKLRVPTVSRLQKAHNVSLMLTQMVSEGVSLDDVPHGTIDKYSIVDGNQNLTLALIWNVIFQYSISRILAVNQLEAEINILKSILNRRKKMFRPSLRGGDDDYVLGLPSRRLSVNEASFFKSRVLTALMEWCQTVCSFYDVPVDNFTVSFSDGRVLCLLIHHYHPELVPFHRVKMCTALSRQLIEMDLSRDFLTDPVVETERFRDNERENFKLLAEAMSGLAAVPSMVFPQDMIGTIPDERVVITFVAYLCASLVDISQEFRAAQRIQRLWKRYKFLQRHEEMRGVRKDVIKVQSLMRMVLAGKKLDYLRANREAILAERREYAARRIQQGWRGAKEVKLARGEFLAKREAAVKLQQWYRGILEVRWRDRICAARKIQSVWRGHRARCQLERAQSSVIKIQAAYRGHQCRRRFLAQRSAASVISARWKATIEFQTQRAAACTVQRYWRGHAARVRVEKLRAAKEACLYIQSVFRGVRVRRHIARTRNAAITIQQTYRAVCAMRAERGRYLAKREAAVTIQRVYRGVMVRREMELRRAAVIKIQAAVRGWVVRLCVERQRRAASTIQIWYRSHTLMVQERDIYQSKRVAAVSIQSLWRMLLVQRRVTMETKAVTRIQTAWRAHRDRKHFLVVRSSAISIQAAWRRYKIRKQSEQARLALLRSVLTVQSLYRGGAVRRHLVAQQNSATLLQAVYRGGTIFRYQIFTNLFGYRFSFERDQSDLNWITTRDTGAGLPSLGWVM
eukprot:sb/3460639/